MSSLEQALALILAAHAETVGVCFHDLQTGERVELHARETFHAASTMKLAVLLAAYRLHVDLEQPVRVENRFTSIADGSPFAVDPKDDDDPWPYTQLGKEIRLGVLLERMIVRSSNLATNVVMRRLQAASVERVCRDVGARDIRILRGVEDLKAHEKGLDNTATPYDLALLLEAMPREGIEILARQELNEGIPAGLPPGTRVAHKTGDITRHYHDAALVFPPGRKPYVLVVMTRGFKTTEEASAVVRDISRTAWKYAVDSAR
ncbi:MAG TPA: serine hydrolase [Myxococcales bacterium]|nr:serine hydrolase [Myxococcales bacterium]